MKRIITYFLIFTFCHHVFAQSKKIDSLVALLKTEKEDTNKVKTLKQLSNKFQDMAVYPKTESLAQKALELSQKINYKIGLADAYNMLSECYFYEDNDDKSMDSYLEELRVSKEIGYYKGIANAYIGLGEIYVDIQEYDYALVKYDTGLSFAQKANDSVTIASAWQDIGNIYTQKGDYSSALLYCNNSVTLFLRMGDTDDASNVFSDIGDIYTCLKNYSKSLELYNKAILLAQSDSDMIAIVLASIGNVYFLKGDYNKALTFSKKSYLISRKNKLINDLKDADSLLSKIYEKKGNISLSYMYYKNYVHMQDSIFGPKSQKKIYNSNLKYTTELKRKAAKAEQDKKDALAATESKRQKLIIGFVIAIALAVGFIALIIFRSLRITRKQKDIIELQKSEVENKNQVIEQKNKDILDSITYAKRLQDAILPPLSLIEKYFPESFVFYKPKDIVAGDFYWMEREGDVILLAACDCTGHGVPGALVSVVCSNALNRAVKEFHLTEPGKILDKTRELVLETFAASGGKINDGMDISLISINTNTKELQWSGANNALYIIPPPLWGQKAEIQEILPDKQPIGYFPNIKPFTNHTINFSPLRSNSPGCLYLITDGFADQFGGPKGKKFKYAQLKEKLMALYNKPMNEQKEILEKEFEYWKGELEQTDDVCVIGIRI